MALNSSGFNTPIEALQFLDQESASFGFPVFGMVFLFVITLTLFMVMKSYTTSARAFAATFGVMGVLAFLMFIIGLIQGQVLAFYLVGFIVTATMLRMEANK